jgi:hypothetical protein
MRHATGTACLPGISLVIEPDQNGKWRECTKKEDIEDGCIWYSKKRFCQTKPTPFMQQPLVVQFGYLGIGPQAQSVLDGTYQPLVHIDPYAARLL